MGISAMLYKFMCFRSTSPFLFMLDYTPIYNVLVYWISIFIAPVYLQNVHVIVNVENLEGKHKQQRGTIQTSEQSQKVSAM